MNMTYEKALKLLEANRVKPIKIEAGDEETKKYNLDNIYAFTLAKNSLIAMQGIQEIIAAEDAYNLEEFKSVIVEILKAIDEKMNAKPTLDTFKEIFDNMLNNYMTD